MSQDRTQRLQKFVDWSAQHITGDEKGQAQIFLDRLFQAFGQPGSLEVGGTLEKRIKNDDVRHFLRRLRLQKKRGGRPHRNEKARH